MEKWNGFGRDILVDLNGYYEVVEIKTWTRKVKRYTYMEKLKKEGKWEKNKYIGHHED